MYRGRLLAVPPQIGIEKPTHSNTGHNDRYSISITGEPGVPTLIQSPLVSPFIVFIDIGLSPTPTLCNPFTLLLSLLNAFHNLWIFLITDYITSNKSICQVFYYKIYIFQNYQSSF